MGSVNKYTLRKDKNWDGQVDITDHMMEAEEKTKNG